MGLLQIGQLATGNNTDYSAFIARHGTGATPGTWSDTPELTIYDSSGDGPASPGQGLLQIVAAKIASTDTNAANARLLNIRNDDSSSIFSVNAKGDVVAAGILTADTIYTDYVNSSSGSINVQLGTGATTLCCS
jgi:hypothetical protein